MSGGGDKAALTGTVPLSEEEHQGRAVSFGPHKPDEEGHQEQTKIPPSNGDVVAKHQWMQQTRSHCGKWCSVDRISCNIGCDRRGSRSKERRVAAICISRHSSYGQLQRGVGISVR